ncbi:hypothetical protein Pcinc_031451 [Petrolisthes cinctipes]|uniref:Uncharacterized protein n=1 Tax=Petrolisthes cinctipes TaxID=88211 RepID=A0AAE1K120_PETCI|nr:hypothetical protein Pcinc_031451 [Petrolisthes cinctipes]
MTSVPLVPILPCPAPPRPCMTSVPLVPILPRPAPPLHDISSSCSYPTPPRPALHDISSSCSYPTPLNPAPPCMTSVPLVPILPLSTPPRPAWYQFLLYPPYLTASHTSCHGPHFMSLLFLLPPSPAPPYMLANCGPSLPCGCIFFLLFPVQESADPYTRYGPNTTSTPRFRL